MAGTPHLLFKEHGILYGVRAEAVKEILWLPELTPAQTMPEWICGVFSLRGRIVPVIDLGLLFGRKGRRHSLSDCVIITDSGERLTGIIAEEAVDMLELSGDAVQALPHFGRENRAHGARVEGEARAGDRLATILDIGSLIAAVSAEADAADLPGASSEGFCPSATSEVRKTFHERAALIDKDAQDAAGGKLLAVAVIALNGEHLGIDLDTVREFSSISGLTQVPCCPPEILGNMNLRGKILTIIDIREALQMDSTAKTSLKKAVVAETGGITTGIAVEDAFEIIYVAESGMRPADFVVEYNEGYIKGMVPYNGSTIACLDMQKLLSRKELIVDEKV